MTLVFRIIYKNTLPKYYSLVSKLNLQEQMAFGASVFLVHHSYNQEKVIVDVKKTGPKACNVSVFTKTLYCLFFLQISLVVHPKNPDE